MKVLRALLPFVLALLAGALILFVTGKHALATYGIIFKQAFLGVTNICDTLLFSTPLIFTGLATAIAFRANVFFIGVEGSLYLGAFAAAWVGFTFTSAPGILVIPAAFLLAALVGGLWAVIPAVSKAWLRVDEVVTTFMLNYVAIFFCSFLVNGPFLAKGTANSMSPMISAQAHLGPFISSSQLNASFPLAVLFALILWWLLRSTTAGYRIRMVGDNAQFARASGINVASTMVFAMVASGVIGGIAGACQVLGVNGRFIDNFSPGYGFQGIAVALLAGNHPLFVLPAAFFFGAIENGGGLVQLFSNIPIDLVNVLQGTVMLFATVQFAASRLRLRKAAA